MISVVTMVTTFFLNHDHENISFFFFNERKEGKKKNMTRTEMGIKKCEDTSDVSLIVQLAENPGLPFSDAVPLIILQDVA